MKYCDKLPYFSDYLFLIISYSIFLNGSILGFCVQGGFNLCFSESLNGVRYNIHLLIHLKVLKVLIMIKFKKCKFGA